MPKCPQCNEPHNVNDETCPNCGRVLPSFSDTLASGVVLQGRYEIEQLAHSGGMGHVYFAKDLKLYGRPCVVKQVKQKVEPNTKLLKKLEQEALRMAKLHHPNVAMIMDHFVENQHYFLVVEYVRGKTLSEVSKERKLNEEEVVNWSICMCDVLDYIHQQGVIHRDISPDNVMLTNEGTIKFIDFGTLRELHHIVTEGTVGIGKYGYTPPEQWHNRPVPQSDIFAMGATIYYLLSGFLPRSEAYLSGHGPQWEDLNPNFPPLRGKNPRVSQRLEAVLKRALELDLNKRFSSATELRQGLVGVLAGGEKWELGAEPILGVDCEFLKFADVAPGTKVSKSLSLLNMGNGRLVGTITATQPWLKVSPPRLDLESGRKDFEVTVDTTQLAADSDGTGYLEITTNGGTASVGVSISTTARRQAAAQFDAKAPKRSMRLAYTVGAIAGGIFLLLVPIWSTTKTMPVTETVVTTITKDELQTVQVDKTFKVYSGWMKDRRGTKHTVDINDGVVDIIKTRGPDNTWVLTMIYFDRKEVIYRDITDYDLTRGNQITMPVTETKTVQVAQQVPQQVTSDKNVRVRVSLLQLLLGNY